MHGVCGCGILVAHYGVLDRDCLLEWVLVLDVSVIWLASWGWIRDGQKMEEGVEGIVLVIRDCRERHAL